MVVTYLFKLIDLYSIIIIISVIGSWMDPRRNSPFFNMVRRITDPFLNIFRVVIPLGNGGIDISPVIAFTILNAVKEVILRVAYF